MPATIGAIVSITYDTDETISPGDWLRTGTGRGYCIVAVRTVAKGPNAGRRHHLRAIVHEEVPHGAPPNARVHPLYWYKRERSRPG